jgi:hypothetical protein
MVASVAQANDPDFHLKAATAGRASNDPWDSPTLAMRPRNATGLASRPVSIV